MRTVVKYYKFIKNAKYKFDYDMFRKCGNNPRQLWN